MKHTELSLLKYSGASAQGQPIAAPVGNERGTASALLLLARFLRLRALGTQHQAADFISDETAKTDHRDMEAVVVLESVLSRASARSVIDLGRYLEIVCDAIRPTVENAASLRLNSECEKGCEIDSPTALGLSLIVCELVLNAAKYAHPARVPGRVDVACRLSGRDLSVEVADDGVGLPAGFDPASDGRLGLEMVRVLARQLHAQTFFQSDPLGLRVVLRLTK